MNKEHYLRQLKDNPHLYPSDSPRRFKATLNLIVESDIKQKLIECAKLHECSVSTLCALIFKEFFDEQ